MLGLADLDWPVGVLAMSANMGESEASAIGPTEWGQGQHGVGP